MALVSKPRLLDAIREQDPRHPALIDARTGEELSYGRLLSIVDQAAGQIRHGGRRLHFLFCRNTPGSIVSYLGCLAADVPVCLLESSNAASQRILSTYQPDVVLAAEGTAAPESYALRDSLPGGFGRWEREATGTTVHPDLSLLLTTSGSTGDPKLVRLTQRNIVSNAASIAQYLGLGPEERSIQGLPMSYSYGLSLVHSHLISGGTIVLTTHSFMRPEFWRDFDKFECTSFAGVPHMYQTLARLRFEPSAHASLRTLTQAGGKLDDALIERYSAAVVAARKRFFVMYGQTEATARISYVPPDVLPSKIGSIGIAIPGGTLSLAPVEGSPGLDELVYSGPNVMMGYADSIASLAAGDEQGGLLRTGDLARVDSSGFFYITGRLKRFAKLFGKRVNLMDVEAAIESQYSVRAAAIDGGHDQLLVLLESNRDVPQQEIVMDLAGLLSVPPNAIRVRAVSELPLTASGKKDYATISRL